MRTLLTLFQIVGLVLCFVGFMSVLNAAFDLNLAYKGTPLPNDLAGAGMILAFGAILAGVLTAIDKIFPEKKPNKSAQSSHS